ncbi:MAG: MBL fold metallo-hydrolase [Candidatus Hermodarchaeota archaeon]
MDKLYDWYEVIKQKDYLYVIRERIDKIDPRLYTEYTNMYLIVGSKKALLIDTGCGLYPLKPLIKQLIGNQELIVINTHSHFDHRGANNEFTTIFVHEKEEKALRAPVDVSWLKDSPEDRVKRYEINDYKFLPSQNVETIKEGDEFDLGIIKVKVYHTPGHSEGSISLLSDRGELFTGDTVHYGAMYLPKRNELPIILDSVKKLINIAHSNNIHEIYPAHEQFSVGIELLERLAVGISNIDSIWYKGVKDTFLQSWILEDEHFKYVVSL